MNEVTNWTFGETEVRTIELNGVTWWVLKDVCTVLEIKNHKDIPDRLESDEVGRFELPHPQNPEKSIEMVCVNESGLYSVILRSDKPQAKPFRKWVTGEVLPTIRKHGSYSIQKDSYMIDDPIERAKRWIEEQSEKKALETTVAIQNQQIAELTPKAGYYDVILACKDAISITVIAKDYGKSARWMNEKLHELGVQFKDKGGKIWLLYQKYAEQGYTCTKTAPYTKEDGSQGSKIHTYWTQKGRIFIYDLLKSYDILPVIETCAR